MRSITKKWMIAGAAAATALGMLTACVKVTEKQEDAAAESSAVTAEELPTAEKLKNGEEPKADDNRRTAPEADGADAAGSEGNTFHYINEDKELYGDIWEVGEGKFTVTEIYLEETDDSGEVMVSVAEEAAGEEAKITVVYDEKTKFITQKIKDGGASHEEKEGTAADLKKGLTAEMNGSWEKDVFHATEILIVEVIWD